MKAILSVPVKGLLTGVGLLTAQLAAAQNYAPEGYWINDKGNSKIHIFKTTAGTYAGKLIWLKEPNRDGKPKLDVHNPNEALRTRPVMGLVMLTGLRHEEKNDYVDGKAYDPSSGKTYECKLTVNGPDEMTLRGFVGFSLIGKSVIWKRTQL
jgi:uncharacterized protein (DUF2147 family)